MFQQSRNQYLVSNLTKPVSKEPYQKQDLQLGSNKNMTAINEMVWCIKNSQYCFVNFSVKLKKLGAVNNTHKTCPLHIGNNDDSCKHNNRCATNNSNETIYILLGNTQVQLFYGIKNRFCIISKSIGNNEKL